jgi:superfamily II DNA/RNA helicase
MQMRKRQRKQIYHTKLTANWLNEAMTREGHSVALLTGELDVSQRAEVITRFRDAREKVIITTNVSARERKIHKLDAEDIDEIEKLEKS